MNHRRLTAIFVVCLGVAALATGCNREGLPKLAPVSGIVTLDDQPVSDALVTFDGSKAGEPPSQARTDASGKYELFYSRGHKGATIGEHVVHISSYSESGEDDTRQVHKETIPSRYNVKSELKADVKRGANKLDFPLKGGGEILQPGEEPTPKGKKGRFKKGCG